MYFFGRRNEKTVWLVARGNAAAQKVRVTPHHPLRWELLPVAITDGPRLAKNVPLARSLNVSRLKGKQKGPLLRELASPKGDD